MFDRSVTVASVYDILKNKKFDVKKLTPKISEEFTIVILFIVYCHNLTPSNAWFEGVSLRPCRY